MRGPILRRPKRPLCRGLMMAAAMSFAAPTAAQSQEPTARAVVQGAATDSLRGGPLAGAYIELLPSGRQVLTDAAGVFRFDSVRAGVPLRLRVMHALLDTLGLGIVSAEFTLRPMETRQLDVGVPSPSRLVSTLCPREQLARGPAAIVGFVKHPESGAVIPGVTISLVYDDAPISVVKWPVNRVVTSDSAGHFVICGLPERVTGHVRLRKGAIETADIPVESAGQVSLRGISMVPRLAADGDSGGAVVRIVVGEGSLTGRILTRAGTPVEGARVQIAGSPSAAITRGDGSFRLDSLPIGTQSLSVRKIGHSIVERAVEIDRYRSEPVTIHMDAVATYLDPVVSRSHRDRQLDDIGFNRRKAQGLGFFLEGEQIDRGPPVLGEALRMVPGLRIGYDAQNQRAQKTMIMSSRDSRGCVRYVVDGVYWQEIGGDIERFIRPQEVEALEMYNPAAVPGEFAAASRGKCSVLVLWTKHKVRPAQR